MYDNLFNSAPSSELIPAADSSNSNQLFKTMLTNSMEERDKTLFKKWGEKLAHIKKRHLFLLALLIVAGLAFYAYTSGIGDFSWLSPKPELVQSASSNIAGGAGEDSSARIKVYVLGAVKQPGVYDLNEGDRIDDALSAAGGAGDDAALVYVNLAVKAEDGQEIYVPTQAEIDSGYFEKISGVIAAGGVTGVLNTNGGNSASTENDAASAQSSSTTGTTGGIINGKVNINKASSAELQTLSGIGAATAQKIIDYRNANGAFRSIEQLKNVSGIGDAKYAAVSGSITV